SLQDMRRTPPPGGARPPAWSPEGPESADLSKAPAPPPRRCRRATATADRPRPTPTAAIATAVVWQPRRKGRCVLGLLPEHPADRLPIPANVAWLTGGISRPRDPPIGARRSISPRCGRWGRVGAGNRDRTFNDIRTPEHLSSSHHIKACS